MKEWDGTFEMVNPADINFDRTKYQRAENWPLIAKVASDPFWPAFVVIPCAKREYSGGTFWAYDGQQRLLGVMAAADPPKKVPIVWWPVKDRAAEAEIFLDVNVNRVSVSTLAKFKAQLGAGNQTCLRISQIVDECGYTIGINGETAQAIAAIGGLIEIYNEAGEAGLRVALSSVSEEWADERAATSSSMLKLYAKVLAEMASNGGVNQAKLVKAMSLTTPGAVKRRAKDIRYGTDCTMEVALRRAFKALAKI